MVQLIFQVLAKQKGFQAERKTSIAHVCICFRLVWVSVGSRQWSSGKSRGLTTNRSWVKSLPAMFTGLNVSKANVIEKNKGRQMGNTNFI